MIKTIKNRKLCASCLNFNFNKTIKSRQENKPKWLSKIDYVEEFVKKSKNFSNKYPKKYNKIVEVDIGKRFINRKILYWAAKPSKDIIINGAKKAYGNFTNSGVTSVDQDGYAKIKFIVPQNYKTIEKGENDYKSFYKHIHYVVSDDKKQHWIFHIFTKFVQNNYNYKDFIQKLNSNKHVILNVLPREMYDEDHIKNTHNLPVGIIKNISKKTLEEWLNLLINLHYPKIKKLLGNKLSINDIPIICYCANNKCRASKNAAKELIKKDFINVSIYEKGMKEYRKYNKI